MIAFTFKSFDTVLKILEGFDCEDDRYQIEIEYENNIYEVRFFNKEEL